MVRCQSSAEVSTSGPTAPMIPALLNMQSSRPHVSPASATAAATWSSSVTSVAMKRAASPSSSAVGLTGLDLDVGDDDPGALVDEALCGGPSDAARRAGDRPRPFRPVDLPCPVSCPRGRINDRPGAVSLDRLHLGQRSPTPAAAPPARLVGVDVGATGGGH